MKISYDEMKYITRKKKHAIFEKYCAFWTLTKRNDNEYTIHGYVRWWYCIIAFIPAMFLMFCACIWQEGLKSFEIPKRQFYTFTCIGSPNENEESCFGRMRIIYEKKANSLLF